ncbi:UDP-phosphate N-acetylglucosaminyl 1-phosphate transferase [Pseudoalteromonas lipolytica SCSIO 04301]|uniref:Undecaprenyl-phosphate alpha-N-acetylglucosaminyl 1-phosphate transferase n=1 Tax=Pseudoalteromonas lipolytica TaxID=570156 RepID=A0ABY1GPJ9_9GAMM|nr:UDP-N-acetylglucosamine--undecaprenyl-phosphate N-acetylglucosaminephosphotransferase [Pseudoalteromonas lipolytica]EWH04604.1 UDP-phosphate N-acetylglucosaminyl 1-phosphate transferase [Pseudoalteromonas lipolytica SCSIO 04301]MBE0349629.1 UDP-GlcNAc:undecaprenyl-phosphate GlcNAc-1-phosphate transferase [Pseudoalteromonas lipolytica LMEB 39]SFT78284.1 UDP-GlcNAc:undecaprenyl-phosphate GlcNAc-1-phosphate transferase [Pseudoalteromonas lipolytica]
MDFFLAVISSFVFSFFAINLLRPVAIKIDLVDKPSERKNHIGHVPLIGGVAIFCSVLTSSSMWLTIDSELFVYLFSAGLMVCLGVVDDKHDISVRSRVAFQVLVATFMIVAMDNYIIDLGDLLFFGNVELGKFGILLTYLAIVAIINAFNMVDGIDGLLGSMAISTLSSIALLLLLKQQENLFTVLVIVAILPYLIFNLGVFGTQYRKIFMGDAGSMFIGFTVVWLLIDNTQGPSATFRPVTALWIVAVPLIDMGSIIIRRIKKGSSPFKADREHIHHLLLKAGFSKLQTLIIIVALSVSCSLIGVLTEWLEFNESVMFVSFLLFFMLYNLVLSDSSRLKRPLKLIKLKNLKRKRCQKLVRG